MLPSFLSTLKEKLRSYPSIEQQFLPISQVATPRIGIHLTRLEENAPELPIGTSKFGGYPDTPPDFEWKFHLGNPLAFLGQVRLDELAQLDIETMLPKTGLLSVFCDYSGDVWGTEPEDKTAWFVEIFPLDGLVQTLQPADDGESYADFEECTLEYRIEFDIPDTLDISLDDEQYEDYQKLKYDGAQSHLLGQGHIHSGERGIPNGLSTLIGIETEEQVCTLIKFGSEWQAAMNWGDSDWIQFFIPISDLSRGDFRRVWAQVAI
jgi:uncharacterized protein YwqG